MGLYIPDEIMSLKNINILEKCLLAQVSYYANENGCHASNAHLADLLGVSEPTIMRAIRKLKALKYISHTGQYGKFRKLSTLVKMTSQIDYPSQNDQASLVKVTSDPSQIDQQKVKIKKRINTMSVYSDIFEEFWKKYPHKSNKSGAYSCWKARLKEGPGKIELIMKCLKNYCVKVAGKDIEFILHASTFLNKGHRFLDFENWKPGNKTIEIEDKGWKCKACGKQNFNTMSFCMSCKAEKN